MYCNQLDTTIYKRYNTPCEICPEPTSPGGRIYLAVLLTGKNKPTYTPHVDTGDFVIVINADKVVLTGKKLLNKEYFHYTGYIGGDRYQKAGDALREKPVWVVEHAIRGMLPKTKLGDQMYRKLKVYAGKEHPHAAQQAEELKFDIR